MTPKQQYEARKAERIAARAKVHPQQDSRHIQPDRDEVMEEYFDRFVTAVERIADALEANVKVGGVPSSSLPL